MIAAGINGFFWEAKWKGLNEKSKVFLQKKADSHDTTFQFETVNNFIDILPVVLDVLNIFRVILPVISFKYTRISRCYVYFGYLYMAINMTQPEDRGDRYISLVNLYNVLTFLSLSFNFWGATFAAII